MSAIDKAKNAAEDAKGKGTFGHATGDKDRRKADQVSSDIKDAGEKVEDAFKH